MVKLVVGLKGSGKTKALIEAANTAVETSMGTVVVIEKGTKLIREIKYQARLINTDEYAIEDGEALLGFVAGIIASDHDAKDLFIDQAYKVCTDMKDFERFVLRLEKFCADHEVKAMLTCSMDKGDLPESIAQFA